MVAESTNTGLILAQAQTRAVILGKVLNVSL